MKKIYFPIVVGACVLLSQPSWGQAQKTAHSILQTQYYALPGLQRNEWMVPAAVREAWMNQTFQCTGATMIGQVEILRLNVTLKDNVMTFEFRGVKSSNVVPGGKAVAQLQGNRIDVAQSAEAGPLAEENSPPFENMIMADISKDLFTMCGSFTAGLRYSADGSTIAVRPGSRCSATGMLKLETNGAIVQSLNDRPIMICQRQ